MFLQRTLKSTEALRNSLKTRQVAATSSRFFAADAKKPEEKKEDDALMEQLKQQVIEKQERTILPFHASNDANPAIGNAPIPYPKECAAVSGTADFSLKRHVQIFMPARNQMQSGIYNTRHWEIRFDSSRTWGNPLMGWTSTADPYHGMVLKFDKKEEAIAFAEKEGWYFEIDEPAETGNFEGQLAYSHNFLPLNVENLIKKQGKKSHVHFKHPTGRQSNWVKTLKYHGNGVVAQHGGEATE